MSFKRLGCTAAVVVTLGAIGLLDIAAWIPPAHPIHTPGAMAVEAHIVYGSVPWRGRVPAPYTSLDQVRCQAWPSSPSQPCPDAATLSQRLWPGLVQAPTTLYVAMVSAGLVSGGTAGFNVEQNPSERTLTIHSYASRALFVPSLPQPMTEGTEVAPTLDLLVVSTAGIPAGAVIVWQDGWIERLTGDERDGEMKLGAVAIG
jgi:hypothetical protein